MAEKKVVYELLSHLLRLMFHTPTKVMSSVPALYTVTDILPLLYQPCVNQSGELKRFSPHIKSRTELYKYANERAKVTQSG